MGGSQILRLLEEFKGVLAAVKIDKDLDSLHLPAPSDKLWNQRVSEACQDALETHVVPVVESLMQRMNSVLTRLVLGAEAILSKQKEIVKKKTSIEWSEWSVFRLWLKEGFSNFVEKAAKVAKEKCLGEFYGPRTISWFGRTWISEIGSVENPKYPALLFDRLNQRIAHNVAHKVYVFMVKPVLEGAFVADIQTSLMNLDAHAFADVFDQKIYLERLDKSLLATQEKVRILIRSITYQSLF